MAFVRLIYPAKVKISVEVCRNLTGCQLLSNVNEWRPLDFVWISLSIIFHHLVKVVRILYGNGGVIGYIMSRLFVNRWPHYDVE